MGSNFHMVGVFYKRGFRDARNFITYFASKCFFMITTLRLPGSYPPIIESDLIGKIRVSVDCSIVKKIIRLDKMRKPGNLRILLIMHKREICYAMTINYDPFNCDLPHYRLIL